MSGGNPFSARNRVTHGLTVENWEECDRYFKCRTKIYIRSARNKWSKQCIYIRTKGRTHRLRVENDVNSGFKCEKRAIRTD